MKTTTEANSKRENNVGACASPNRSKGWKQARLSEKKKA